MKTKKIISILAVSLALISCVSATTAVSTETAIPSSIFTPVPPTNTQAPVSENTAQVSSDTSYQLGERLIYEQAGFSFQPIKDYDVIPLDIGNGIQNVILHDKEKNFSIYFVGTKTDSRFKSAGDVLIFWMPALTQNDPEGVINPISDHPITVDDISGISVDVSGKLLKKPLTGQVVSLWVSQSQYLFVLGFSDAENHATLWASEGQEAFDTLVSTIEFSNSVNEEPASKETVERVTLEFITALHGSQIAAAHEMLSEKIRDSITINDVKTLAEDHAIKSFESLNVCEIEITSSSLGERLIGYGILRFSDGELIFDSSLLQDSDGKWHIGGFYLEPDLTSTPSKACEITQP